MTITVPAVMITAPASGQGKSLVTAALARLHRNAGRKVRVFKHGPDYLDPMVLEVASGQPVYQLHPWMTGEAECRWRVAEAAQDADLILIEGAGPVRRHSVQRRSGQTSGHSGPAGD